MRLDVELAAFFMHYACAYKHTYISDFFFVILRTFEKIVFPGFIFHLLNSVSYTVFLVP